jgi:hypothetical protein
MSHRRGRAIAGHGRQDVSAAVLALHGGGQPGGQ